MELLRRLIADRCPVLLFWGPGLLLVLCAWTGCSDDRSGQARDSLRVVQDWSTEGGLQRDRTAPPLALLDAVQVSSTATGHRVVFGFRKGRLPGVTIRLTQKPIRQCGSGRPLELGGQDVLEVRFASARAHTEAGTSTLAKREWEGAFADGVRATIACDFEGQVAWALGLPSSAAYRILADSTAGQMAVDVRW